MKIMLAITMALAVGACSTHGMRCRGAEPINKPASIVDSKKSAPAESHP